MERVRVIVADDDSAVRRWLSEMLADDYDVIAVVKNGQELVDAARRLDPGLVIVDISMPVLNGLEAVRQIKLLGLSARVLFLTTIRNPAYVRRAFEHGALGYVTKGSGVEQLPGALRDVLAGKTFVSPGIAHPGPQSMA